MSETPRSETIPVVYPPYLQVNCEEGEIDLVDLWVRLREYRRLFWISTIALVLIGVLFSLFVFKEHYSLTSAIQIGTLDEAGQIVKIESPESLKSKLTKAMVPATTSAWLKKYPGLVLFKTDISYPKNSDIVLISNRIGDDQVAIFTGFQEELTQKVLDDHAKIVALFQSGLKAQLRAEQARLKELQDPRTLKLQLDQKKLKIQGAEQKLKHLQETAKILQLGGKEAVLRSMTDEQKQLVLNREGKVDDKVLQARYEEILVRNRVQQDQQRQAIKSGQLQLETIKLKHERAVAASQRTIDDIRQKLGSYNISRVVSAPVKSIKPAGLSRTILLVLTVFMALILSFFIVLGALFRDKVRERLAEQA